MSDDSYSLREAARMSGVSLWAIRQGCKNGTIEHVRSGDGEKRVHRRMTWEQVEALRAARTVAPKAEESEPLDEIGLAIAATRAAQRRSTRRGRAA